MAQPAGHIRITTEKLREQGRPIIRQVAAGIQHITVRFPLLHLAQPTCGNPSERIEPQHAKHRFHGDALDRMAVTHVARLVPQNNRPTGPVEPLAEINRPQKGKRSADGGMLGQHEIAKTRQPGLPTQACDSRQAHGKQHDEHKNRNGIGDQ